MKKAAFVASVYGHFQAFHLPYMRLLQRMGYEVHAFARAEASADAAREQVARAGVICRDTPIRRDPFRWDNGRALRVLMEAFSAERFDLVHVHTPVAAVLGRIAARRAGVPHVLYTAHGFHFYRGAPLLHWAIYYPLERWLARWTDDLITINGEDYARAKRFPVRGQVHVVPGVGVALHEFQVPDAEAVRERVRAELRIDPEAFVIVCVAEINANKNQAQLVEAVRLLKERGRSVRCLLVGRGDRQEQVREQVERHGLQREVLLLGQRADVAALLAAADVCTLLSWREGLPRALMEAMAAGKPVVATRVRGNRDVVHEGETGLLVTPGDAMETAEAFARLLDAPDVCTAMGRAGRHVAESFDLARLVAVMERLYRRESAVYPIGEVESVGRVDEPIGTRSEATQEA